MIEARPLLRLSTRLLAALALCLAAAPPTLGQGSGTSGNGGNPPAFRETGLGPLPVLSHTGPGAEFWLSGTTTRTAGIATPTQTCPFNIAGSPLPIGAQVVGSLITWNYLLDGTPPLNDSILVNGSVVVGELVASGSPGLCWGKQGAATYIAWNVLPPFQIGSPLNSFDQLCDKPFGSDPNALGEGVSVLVVYEVAGRPQRTVDLWLGYTSTASNPLGSALSDLLFSATYLGGETHFGLVTLDGQQSQDDFLLNGQPTAGLLNGLHVQGDAWAGLAGPLLIDNLYDEVNDDIQPFLAPGDTQLTTNTLSLGDCSAHTLAALAYRGSPLCRPAVYCDPKPSSLGCMPSMTTSGPGGAYLCPVSGADDFDVIVTDVNTFRMGLVFYSPYGRSSMPFHGGLMCVQGPLLRTPLQPSGGINANTCAGALTLRINDPTSRVDQPPGTTLWLQGWFRDAGASFGEGLSNGLEVTFQ